MKLFDREEGERWKEDGIRRARQNNAEWVFTALEFLHEICCRYEIFTTDKLWWHLHKKKIKPPREPRAMGAVMRIGHQKFKWIKPAEQLPWLSHRVACHRRPLTVWKSMLYEEEKTSRD